MLAKNLKVGDWVLLRVQGTNLSTQPHQILKLINSRLKLQPSTLRESEDVPYGRSVVCTAGNVQEVIPSEAYGWELFDEQLEALKVLGEAKVVARHQHAEQVSQLRNQLAARLAEATATFQQRMLDFRNKER